MIIFIGLNSTERKYSRGEVARANDVARDYFNNDDSSLETDKNRIPSAIKAWKSSLL